MVHLLLPSLGTIEGARRLVDYLQPEAPLGIAPVFDRGCAKFEILFTAEIYEYDGVRDRCPPLGQGETTRRRAAQVLMTG